MKVCIHQPQYIPWVPYIDKVLQSDVFIYLDSVQYVKRGVQNRNQLKSPQGPFWVTIPVVQDYYQKIVDTKISDTMALDKHLKSFQMFYKKAEHFEEIYNLLEKPLKAGHTNLCELNIDVMGAILGYLGYKGKILRSSVMNCEGSSSELILNLCKRAEATEYLAGQGSKDYMKNSDFTQNGIQVKYQKYKNVSYNQCFPELGFCPDLSVVDLLFNCGKSSLGLIHEGRQDWEIVS